MKTIKLSKENHNGIYCYKDETKLFMVTKDSSSNKWRLYRANENNDEIINRIRAWGYTQINSNWAFRTLNDVKMQIEDEIENGAWFDDFQRELKNNYYLD